MENLQIKFFSKNLLKVGFLTCLWYIFLSIGFSKFFISLGVSPTQTLAEMIGALIIPLVPTYFVARYLSINNRKDFSTSWFIGTLIILSISTIGMLNGKNHWW